METNEMKDGLDDIMSALNQPDQQVKRGRGRPPKNGTNPSLTPKRLTNIEDDGNEAETEDSRTIISDESLLPYKIIVSSRSYNIVDNIRPEGAIADMPYAYCTTLGFAIEKIARLKMKSKNKTFSLPEYVKEYQNVIQEIRTKLNF